jgi:hypothetical protein
MQSTGLIDILHVYFKFQGFGLGVESGLRGLDGVPMISFFYGTPLREKGSRVVPSLTLLGSL